MTVSTIKRAFTVNNSYNINNIVSKAKEKNNKIIYFIKKILYIIIHFGFKRSIEKLRIKRREHEIIDVINSIIKNINLNNKNAVTVNIIIHTDLKYGYTIKQIDQSLYIYNGKLSNITGQFHLDQESEYLLVNDINNMLENFKKDIITNFKDYQQYDFSIKIFKEHILYQNMNIIEILEKLDHMLFAEIAPTQSIITADDLIAKLENFINTNEKFRKALLKIKLKDNDTFDAIRDRLNIVGKKLYHLLSLHAILNYLNNKNNHIKPLEIKTN